MCPEGEEAAAAWISRLEVMWTISLQHFCCFLAPAARHWFTSKWKTRIPTFQPREMSESGILRKITSCCNCISTATKYLQSSSTKYFQHWVGVVASTSFLLCDWRSDAALMLPACNLKMYYNDLKQTQNLSPTKAQSLQWSTVPQDRCSVGRLWTGAIILLSPTPRWQGTIFRRGIRTAGETRSQQARHQTATVRLFPLSSS